MHSAKQKRKKKIIKIVSISVSILAVLAALSLLIANFFIPVKYLSAYFVSVRKNPAGEMRVTFVDVGFGDCTIVEFPDGKTALIDAGDGSASTTRTIFAALNSKGIDKIDYLVATSVRGDTCGGFEEIFRYKKVGAVFSPYCPVTYISEGFRSFSRSVVEKGFKPVYLGYGTNIASTGDYRFFTLSPTGIDSEGSEITEMLDNPSRQNIDNASAVLWLEYGGVGFLLAGNVNESVQRKLCVAADVGAEVDGEIIDISGCSVLKVPNRGADSAAFKGFYDTFNPETAIMSVGENALGCPSVNALTYAQGCVGDRLFRTDFDGTVTVTVKDGKYTVSKEK